MAATARPQADRRRVRARPRAGSARHDHRETLRLFPLGVAVIGAPDPGRAAPRSARSDQPGSSASRHPRSAAAKPQRADRVTDIVLAVAERALAVLPGLAPVDRRQARRGTIHRSAAPGLASGRTSIRHLQRAPRAHVRAARSDARGRPDDVGLGGMEIAARRIDAQRPARRSELLPRRQPHRAAQELADRVDGRSAAGATAPSKSASYGTSAASGSRGSAIERRAGDSGETDRAGSPSRGSRATARSG